MVGGGEENGWGGSVLRKKERGCVQDVHSWIKWYCVLNDTSLVYK